MLSNKNYPLAVASTLQNLHLVFEPSIWVTASPHIQILQKFKYNFKHQSVIISKLIILFVYWENIITCFHSAREEEIFYLKIETSIMTAYFIAFYLRQTFSSLPNPENVWGAL